MDWELLADQPLGQKLIKKWFWLYFFMILIAPVSYFTRVIVSNKLEIWDVWIFYSVLWLITLLSLYNDLWLTEALQYYLPKYWIKKEYNNYKTIFYITLIAQLISWIILASIIYLSSNRLALNHFHSIQAGQIIRILCFYFVWINFLQAFNSFYLWFQDTLSSNLTEFSKLYSTFAFTIFFWLTNSLTVNSFSIAWITWIWISLVVSSIIFLKKYSYTFKKWIFLWDNNLVITQFKYAFWVFLWANVWSLFVQIDQQLVVNLLGPQSAGYYTNYSSLISMFLVIIWPLFAILFPIVTELVAKNDLSRLKLLQNLLYKYFSVFAFSMWGLFFALWPQLAIIFFGSKFYYSWELIVYTSPFLFIYVLFIINYYILAWLGKVKARVKILWWALLVNIISNILLLIIFKMWLIGAVISMILWWIVMWILSLELVNKNQPIKFDWKYFISNVIVIVILTLLLFYFRDRVFIINNGYRFHNIYYLVLCLIIYYWIIGMFNYRSIWNLIGEVKLLKKSV